jgi:hypothetical protein
MRTARMMARTIPSRTPKRMTPAVATSERASALFRTWK